MPNGATQAYQAWSEADRRARAAEDLLEEAWKMHDLGGLPPTLTLLKQVSKLRADANEKLREAMRALRS
jgi:hypothetical protein